MSGLGSVYGCVRSKEAGYRSTSLV